MHHQHVQHRAPQASITTSIPVVYGGPNEPSYTSTDTASSATFTGDPDYFVFPNPEYISRFYKVRAQDSGITNLDTDLYNRCYLPGGGPLPYLPPPYNGSSVNDSSNAKREESWVEIIIEKPDYQIEVAPCRRQGAINTNCYFKNTNGTFSGLTKYDSDFEEQQHCFCEKYPFFDSVLGCSKCFEMHGGISGIYFRPSF